MPMDADLLHAAADQASGLLKSLAHRHRLLIVCQLVAGERCVGDLAAYLGVRESTVSQHLALLRRDGVVSTRREAQTIWYSIASTPARGVIEALYAGFCGPAAAASPAPRRDRKKPRKATR